MSGRAFRVAPDQSAKCGRLRISLQSQSHKCVARHGFLKPRKFEFPTQILSFPACRWQQSGVALVRVSMGGSRARQAHLNATRDYAACRPHAFRTEAA